MFLLSAVLNRAPRKGMGMELFRRVVLRPRAAADVGAAGLLRAKKVALVGEMK